MDRRIFIKNIGLQGLSTGLLSQTNFQQQPGGWKEKTGIELSEKLGVVQTERGAVRGYRDNGIFTFKGIPYGETTGHENRFMPAVKPASWTGVRNAIAYGPVCPQKTNKGWASDEYAFLFQWDDGHPGEDCLRLNIWTPEINKTTGKRPVMFWIHGGAYFSGSSQEHPSYDGRNLSELGDVVVVSVNHRLNVFGFLDLSAYGERYENSANAGMLDLVSALQWVRDNIQQFGGDPHNVTIFGQSGGAAKVTTLMAMPAARGLFHKAIAQSTSASSVATKDYAAVLAAHVLEALDIPAASVHKMHEVSFQALVEASVEAERRMNGVVPPGVGRAGWQPVVDGKVIPGQPFETMTPERVADVPFMIGSNRHEWSASIGDTAIESLNEEGLRTRLREKYGEKSTELYAVIRRVYPRAKPVEILSFLNPYTRMAYHLATKKSEQKSPVFHYMFSWNTPVLDGRPRAFHCSEIPFTMYNTDRAATMTGGGQEASILSEKISRAWISFARTGNPNHTKLTHWPAFTPSIGQTMVLDNVCQVRNNPDSPFISAFEKM